MPVDYNKQPISCCLALKFTFSKLRKYKLKKNIDRIYSRLIHICNIVSFFTCQRGVPLLKIKRKKKPPKLLFLKQRFEKKRKKEWHTWRQQQYHTWSHRRTPSPGHWQHTPGSFSYHLCWSHLSPAVGPGCGACTEEEKKIKHATVSIVKHWLPSICNEERYTTFLLQV